MLMINVLAYYMPVAFAVMLVASVVLLHRTRQRHFLVQVIGFAAFVVSQAVLLGAYRAYPLQYGSDGDALANGIRDNLALIALWLSVFGLAVAAIGYILQCVAAVRSRSNI